MKPCCHSPCQGYTVESPGQDRDRTASPHVVPLFFRLGSTEDGGEPVGPHARASSDVEQQREVALQYGVAPAVVELGYLAVCPWMLGLPGQANQRIREANGLAERTLHPTAVCYALNRSCRLAALRGTLRASAVTLQRLTTWRTSFGLEKSSRAAHFRPRRSPPPFQTPFKGTERPYSP